MFKKANGSFNMFKKANGFFNMAKKPFAICFFNIFSTVLNIACRRSRAAGEVSSSIRQLLYMYRELLLEQNEHVFILFNKREQNERIR